MRFRLQAFGLHLAGSTCALTLVLGGLYLGWYRWPGWYLTGVLRVLIIVGIVDLALGPMLTFVVANPRKAVRELTRDIAIIVTVQVVALVYGAATLWQGRPLYYTFSADRLEMVQASDLRDSEIRLARRQNPTLAPHWNSLPRWVWAPLPDDPAAAAQIVNGAVLGGGQDVIDLPRYFRPWPQGLPQLRQQLSRVGELKYFSKHQKLLLAKRLSGLGLSPENKNVLVMWGVSRRLIVAFDQDSLAIKAILLPP